MPAPRDGRFEIRIADEERAHYQAAADRAGESLAVWIRRACRERALREEGERLGILPPTKRRRAK